MGRNGEPGAARRGEGGPRQVRGAGSGSVWMTVRRETARVSATYRRCRPRASLAAIRAGSTTMTWSNSRPLARVTGTRVRGWLSLSPLSTAWAGPARGGGKLGHLVVSRDHRGRARAAQGVSAGGGELSVESVRRRGRDHE